MESFAPFPAPTERTSDSEPSKQKSRWNFFEMFKKRDETAGVEFSPSLEVQDIKQPARPAETAAARPEGQRFAATVMSLLRGESARPAATSEVRPVPAAEAVLAAERVVRQLAAGKTAEEADQPEQPAFIERAKEMGRGVLRMLTRARDEVRQADAVEHFTNPTSIESLAVADADVRAAMEELVAPIEALQASAGREPSDAIEAAVLSGGDRDPSVLFEPKTPLARTLQVAAAVAGVTAREVLHAKERAWARTGAARKAGLFALGAATVGGFVYTWNRLREIKKEQRDIRREHRRFEAEVREAQAKEERRLRVLETTNVQGLTPPERRQYVEEVSEFAHRQAAEIRTAARTREIIYRPAGSSLSGAIAGAFGEDATRQGGASRQPEPAKTRRQSSQAWLWGFMLGVAVVILIVLWGLRIL